MKTHRHLLLLKTDMGAGHGGASGRYNKLKDVAFDYAFLFNQFGRARGVRPGKPSAANQY